MKKILKILAVLIFVLLLGFGLFLGYIVKFKPNIPIEEIKVELTPERIERGKYLANNVARCIDCHSKRDWSKFSGPVISGTEGQGGEIFDKQTGFPGTYIAPNITPFNLKDWSDGEIMRAIAEGVSKDGRPMFPVMPYPIYGKMDKEDIFSIIAYLRTLPSIEKNNETSTSNFPMNIIIHTIPQKAEFSTKPTDKVSYGKYLANFAMCAECHTQAQRGQIMQDKLFGGGRVFKTEFGTLVTPNISPDKDTGIGSWNEELFVQHFKVFVENPSSANQSVASGEFNTTMPWLNYSKMTREDLAAIYAYLKTVSPIQNKIESKFIKK